MPGLDDIKKMADDHDEQVDESLQKGDDALVDKVGHADQIGSVVDKAQEATGDGDSSK